ncbi:hypothetical protein D7294_19405 [Streptomyces hoynatensis]|uniref:Uncharacterized protein n=1 Tax=Streptomyces hoynatensis TaxID=1141874 RepID=A0A3A9YY32_9ACTN|nr:hypothetical protein D7294_19405 [Streptomyces hoynatensis]
MARHVLGALKGTQEPPGPGAFLAGAADTKAALAAVRVLGPDVFAPLLLTGAPFGAADRDAVTEAFRVFPPLPQDGEEVAWRDHAAATLLARHGGEPPGAAPPPVRVASRPWREGARTLARLAPLTLPGLPGPFTEPPAAHLLTACRGLARSLLRRDHTTAARLARWAALAGRGARRPLDVATALRHLELCGGSGARVALDIEIARRLLAGREGRTG